MSPPSFTFTKPDGFAKNTELLEPGWYTFEVINAYDRDIDGEPLVSRNEIPFFKLVCQESIKKVVVFHFLFLDPEQASRLSVFLSAIGYDFEDGQEVNLEASTFVSHVFRGRVENAPGKDGVVRNKISRVAFPEADPAVDVVDAPGLEDEGGAMPTDLVKKEEEGGDEIPF